MECDWLAGLDREVADGQLSGADAIVGCSDYITNAIRRRFPHYAAKCRTIYNGVDVSEFAPSRKAAEAGSVQRVIFINRISPEKGLHVLLNAFAQVVARRPKAVLEIIGPDDPIPLEAITSIKDNPVVNRLAGFYQGNYPEQMRQRVRDDDALRNRVTFTGPVPHWQLPGRIARAHILVQPSIFDEPFGIAIAEAMAAGLPVIGSSAGGIPELIVDGQTGILVDRDNPSALASALLRLMDSPTLAQAMGIAGRRRAENKFAWERITDDMKSCCFARSQPSGTIQPSDLTPPHNSDGK
jgi:glycosyltransferase involved in cell wall biosynthesis